jgi:hypothetical protein
MTTRIADHPFRSEVPIGKHTIVTSDRLSKAATFSLGLSFAHRKAAISVDRLRLAEDFRPKVSIAHRAKGGG